MGVTTSVVTTFSAYLTLIVVMASISTTSAITTSVVMVVVLVVSIVAIIIASTFIAVSTFSIVTGVTKFSENLTLTYCYGIYCYNIYYYNIHCYNICFSIRCYLCLCFSIFFLDPPNVGVVFGGRNTSLATHFQALTSKMKWLVTSVVISSTVITS